MESVNRSEDKIDEFLACCKKNILRKSSFYDGIDRKEVSTGIDRHIRFAAEELGEICSAITRERPEVARAECLDLVNSVLLVYLSLES